MAKEVINRHKRRWCEGETHADESLNDAINGFNELVDNLMTPSCHRVQYTLPLDHESFYAKPIDGLVDKGTVGVSVVCSDLDEENTELSIKNGLETNVLISDFTRQEQIKDLKLLHTKLNSQIDSGSYIYWNNEFWIVSNEEHNSVHSHRTFAIEKCSTVANIKINGNVYTYPISTRNLTIYSDGIRDLVNMDISSAKYSIQIAENEITNSINVDTRFVIRGRAFATTIVDDVTIKNVRTLTILETVVNSLDDLENDIAWNKNSDVEKNENPSLKIVGDDFIYIGGTAEYEFVGISRWELERTEKAKIISSEVGKCKIKCVSDSSFIGDKIILYATDSRGNMWEKVITIKGMF